MDTALLIMRARKRKGWSKAEAARKLGVSRQTITDWETGRSAPNRNRAPHVATVLEIPLAALAGDPAHANVAFVENEALTSRRVPLLDWVDAGRGAAVTAAYVSDSTHKYITTTFATSSVSFALEVRGSSMEPDFRDGDIIVIDPNVEARPNDFIVVELLAKGDQPGPGEVTFKQYRPRGPEGKSPTFDLLPLNPDFQTITVNKNNPGRIIGTVVEHRKNLRR